MMVVVMGREWVGLGVAVVCLLHDDAPHLEAQLFDFVMQFLVFSLQNFDLVLEFRNGVGMG